jgi:AraC-like DNA-binding protein
VGHTAAPPVTTGIIDDAFGAWTYHHHRPTHLAQFVDLIWLFDGTMACLRERTFPNGLLEIIVHLGPRYSIVEEGTTSLCPVASVSGLQLRHLVVEAPPDRTTVLGIRLTPAGAYALFATPLHELSGVTIDLEDVAGDATVELVDACADARAGQDCIDAAVRWIDRRLARTPRIDAGIGWMVEEIARRDGAVSIAQLRDALGWSKTRLTTTFGEQVGVSPKQYARVRRFTRALNLIHTGRLPFVDVAANGGYYDQPHLNAEFKELSGFTPTEFLRAHRYPNTVSVADV